MDATVKKATPTGKRIRVAIALNKLMAEGYVPKPGDKVFFNVESNSPETERARILLDPPVKSPTLVRVRDANDKSSTPMVMQNHPAEYYQYRWIYIEDITKPA